MYAALFGLTVLSGIVFALLPSKQQLDALARKDHPEPFDPIRRLSKGDKEIYCFRFVERMAKAALHGNVLLLSVTCVYQGFFNSFWMGVYPTSLSFTQSMRDDHYMVAFYSLFVGLAEMCGKLSLVSL